MNKARFGVVASAVLLTLGVGAVAQEKQPDMTFFISSVGSGKGADFGGLAGADKHCQSLAEAAGAGKRTWRAYLSASAAGGSPAVNARDRIGKGPWHSAEGRLIARNVDELHGINNINRMIALNEKKTRVNGRSESPNMHDILTGSQPDGTAFSGSADTTCGNWTKSDAGSAIVGHFDRSGLGGPDAARSWNSSHATKGCSQPALVSTGGAGLIYCFAADGAPAKKMKK